MNYQGIFSRVQSSRSVKMLSVLTVFLMIWLSVEPAVAALQKEEIPYNLEQRLEQIRQEVDWEFQRQASQGAEGLLKQLLRKNRSNNPLSGRFSPARSGLPGMIRQTSAPPGAIRASSPATSSRNPARLTDPLAQLPPYARKSLTDDALASRRPAKQPKLLAQAETSPVSDAAPSPSPVSESAAQPADNAELTSSATIDTGSSSAEQKLQSAADSDYTLLAQSCYDKYVVGHGSSRQALFIDAYNRVGGKSHLGCTHTHTFWWKGVVRQDFRGSTTVGDAAILHDEGRDNPKNSVPAYPVVGGIWRKYAKMGGPASALGVPTSREGYSTTSTYRYLRQYFEKGYIAYDMGKPYSQRATVHYWPAKDAGKWRAEYHNGYNLNAAPTYVRNETRLDYNWGTNPPGGLCWANYSCWGLWKDNFSARWTKRQYFTEGKYQFTAGADDGVRMWVDGKLILDGWSDHSYQEFKRVITLTEGHHDLKVEYYDKKGNARIKVFWERAAQHNLNVIKEGTGVGGVVASGITCGADCSEYYDNGTEVALAAIPDTGSTFAGWDVNTWERDGRALSDITMAVFDGRLYQALRGMDNGIYIRSTADGQTWTAWSKQGATKGHVGMAVFNGKLFQTVTGSSSKYVYTRSTADGTAWSPWKYTDTTTVMTGSDISLAVFNGRLYQAGRGPGDRIYWRSTADGENWSAWSHDGATKGGVSMAVFDGKLYQSVTGQDSKYVYTRSTADGTAWTSWKYTDTETVMKGLNISLAVFNGNLYQAGQGPDDEVYWRSTADGETWSDWQRGGKTIGDVSMAVFGNRLYQVAQGSNNEMVMRFTIDGQNWTGWKADGTTGDVVRMAIFENKLYQAIRGLNDGVYTRSSADGQNWTIRESANSQCSGTGDCILTMDSAKNVKARFARNGLVAHWKFDENERDSSGNDHHGTPSASLQYVEGKLGNAAVFNGSSQYVTTRDSERWLSFGGTQSFSIEAWINPRSGGNGGTVVGKFNGSVIGEYILQVLPDGIVRFHREISPFGINSTQNIPFDEFTHVVVTYNGADMNIYINGKLDSTQARGAQATDTATPVLIGARWRNGSPEDFFDGAIDNVKLYNRALTPEEVEYFYTPDTSGLIAAWPLNENTEDIGPNRLNGKVAGGLSYVDGAIEKAAALNGADAYIEIGNAPYTDFRGDEEFTVSMWVTGGSRGIAMGRMRYYFRFTDAGIQFIFKQSLLDGDPYMMAIPYPANWNAAGWNCVTFVYGESGARRKIYVNGVLAGEKDHLPMQSLHPLSTLKIGKSDYAGGMYFSGQIDDVRIYDHALPAEQCNCSGDVRPYPLSAEERERLSKLGLHDCMPGSGDPVNSVTGNLLQQSKDIDIPGLGNLDFTLIRTNNGHDSRDGLFGVGWTTFLDMSLRIANDDSVDVRYPDGSGKYYIWSGSEYLPGQNGMFDTLTRTDTGYALSRPDHMTYLFDEHGRLTAIRNRFGHEILLQRNPEGGLTGIIDTVGREILVTQEGRHITSLSGPAGRTVRYAYDSEGNLTHFTDANGGVRVYEYVNHRMTAITDPEGNRYLQNVYDSEGRVIEQIDAGGNVSRWDYSTPNETHFTNNLGHTTRYVFNDRSQVTLIEDASGGTEQSVYNADSLLVSFTDKRGNTRTNTYDERGNMLSATDLGGAATTYTYTAANDLRSVTDAFGATTNYTWDNGKLVRIEYPDGSTNKFTYNQYGQMLTFTDAEGHTTTHSYNAEGLLDTITNPLGGTTRYSYDSAGRQIGMTDANGETSYVEYDGNDNVTRIIFPDGGSMAMEYDGNNNIVKKSDRRGAVTSYQLDANMKLVAETDAEGNTTRHEYDAMYRRVKTTDPRGNVTLYRYNALDRLVEIEDALGGVITFEHDGNGNIVSMTGPMGNQSHFEFDAMNQLVRQIDVLGNVTAFSYDALGQILEITQPNSAVTQYRYNVMGRLTEVRDPLGQSWQTGYDAAGRPTSVTDPLGRTTRSEFDANGNLVKRIGANGAITQFAYDAVGNMREVTDALGRVSRYSYDSSGNVLTATSALGHTVTMTYDAESNLVSMTDPRGASSRFEYNLLGLPVKETDFSGNTTQYEYDAAKNMVKMTQANGAYWTYDYDALNRRISESDPLGNSTAFAYNPLGQLVRKTDALGHATTYEFDALDRLLKEVDPEGNIWEFQYDVLGRLMAQKNPRGATMRYTYDLNDRVLSIQDSLGGEQRFTYDPAGNVSSVSDALGRTATMIYDEVNNLIEESGPLGGKSLYSYDAVGNLLTEQDPLGRLTRYQYDDGDLMRAIIDPLGYQTLIEYDENGNLTGMTDANGNTAAFSYDPNGLLVAETLPGGQTTRYEYDAMLNPIGLVDANGKASSFEYDTLGQLLRETDALGNSTVYAYDAIGRLSQMTDALGNLTSFRYDALSCLTKTVDPAGGVWEFACDPVGNIIAETNPRGATTSYTYDLLDQLTVIRDALGGEQKIAYDAAGNVTGATDANGHSVTFAYNARDWLVEQRDAEGNVSTFAYDAAGNVVAETDALGRVTRYAYNANNALTSITDALGGKTSFAYDRTGNMTGMTDARGHTTRFAYDANDMLVAETLPGGQTTRYEYDAMQNLIARTNPLGNAWSYAYDAAGRLIAEADPLGNTTGYAYDGLGNLTQKTDANGNITGYGYDALARLTSVRQANGAITRYAYDSVGNPTTMTDANGQATTFSYDLLNRLTQEVNPSGNVWRFEYDAAGNLASRDANGQVTHYGYTANNLLARIEHFDGSSVSFGYDAVSNRVSMTDRLGTSVSEYDPLNRLTSTTNSAGYKIGYAYDAVDNLLALTYPDSRKISYVYDNNDFVKEVHTPELDVFSITRDAAQNITGISTPDKARIEYTWDAAERLTGVRNAHGGKTISAFAYTLDPVGNRLTSEEEYSWRTPGRLSHTYAYDAVNRLVRVDDSEGNVTEYSFDAVGNRKEMTTTLAGQTPERVKTTYRYGPENRLTEVRNFVDDGTGNWTLRDESSMQFDGLNRAARRIHTRDGKQTRIDYIYDGLDPIAEYVTSDAGSHHVNYYRGAGSVLGLTQVDAANQGTPYHLYTDGLESVSAVSDPQGRLAHAYRYREYGGIVNEFENPAGAADFTAPQNRLAFTSQEWDPPSGLYHFFARDYDPEVGVWLQQDPYRGQFDDPATLHRYGYVTGNPSSMIDEYGFWGLKSIGKKLKKGIKKGYNKARDYGKKAYNFSRNTFNRGFNFARNTFRRGFNYVRNKASQAYNYAKRKVTQVYRYAKRKWNQAKRWVRNTYNRAKRWVKKKYNQAKTWVKKKYNQARNWVRQKVDWVKRKAAEAKRKTTEFVNREIKKLPKAFQQALKTGKQIVTGDAMKMVTSSIKQVWNDPVGTVMSAAQKAEKYVNWVEDKASFIAENGIKRCQLFMDKLMQEAVGLDSKRVKRPYQDQPINEWAYDAMMESSQHNSIKYMKLYNRFNMKPQAYFVFANRVNTNRPWDYKRDIRKHGVGNFANYLGQGTHRVNGKNISYDVWANVAYGYLGSKSGFSKTELIGGAAIAQNISNRKFTGRDNPGDSYAIDVGIKMWEENGNDLTQKEFNKYLGKMDQNCIGVDRSRCGKKKSFP